MRYLIFSFSRSRCPVILDRYQRKVPVIRKCKPRVILVCSTSQRIRRHSPKHIFLFVVVFVNFQSENVQAVLPPTSIQQHQCSYRACFPEVLTHCLQQGSWQVRTSGQNGLQKPWMGFSTEHVGYTFRSHRFPGSTGAPFPLGIFWNLQPT